MKIGKAKTGNFFFLWRILLNTGTLMNHFTNMLFIKIVIREQKEVTQIGFGVLPDSKNYR